MEKPTLRPPLITVDSRHTFEFKIVLNGLPKCGLHYLVAAIRPLAEPLPPRGIWDRPWSGSFAHHGFSTEWFKTENICFKFGRLSANQFIRTHCGFKQDIAAFLYLFGASHIFIYRDLRDVAVSQAYHILSEDHDRFKHDGRHLFSTDFNECLMQVIRGVDGYPGVMERWELYAPWLRADWVLKVKYEDCITFGKDVCTDIINYVCNQSARIYGCKIEWHPYFIEFIADIMATSATDPDNSATFRKGVAGEWWHEFHPAHVRAFKETDVNNWLMQLGYEGTEDW